MSLESFKTFEGAAKRLEKIFDNNETKQTIFSLESDFFSLGFYLRAFSNRF